MGSWILDCKSCNEAFTYSLIPDTLLLPSPPPFPKEGRERECPHCKTKAAYQQIDLRFRNSSVQLISASHR